MLYQKPLSNGYFEMLEKEINDKYLHDELKTIYIGGGTPSVLSIEDLEKLSNIVSTLSKSEGYEFTFECNIYDINDALLSILRKMGVNRLSIGIESFNQDNLLLMNREASFIDASKKIQLCRYYGFSNINIDLIYALPNESLNVLKKDLDLILKLNPEHISTYSLILEEHTLLQLNGYTPIVEDLDAQMYDYIVKKLKHKGYNHYEISNFAKPGFESKHNLNCWENKEYYGFGLGAAGYYAGVRYENTRSLNKYMQGEFVSNKEIVTKEANMKYTLMLGLRTIKGINIKEFYDTFKENIQDVFNLNEVMNNKDLILKNNQLFINPKKLYLMNEILLKII
jgi:oxygen-independent coproporphyrinogen-3 oxidase